jgi:RHS repeat-associated protein
MNNVRSVVATGGTNTPVTAWSGSYDIAGLLYQEANAADSSPSFHDWTYTNGCLFSTNIFPNGGNQITAYYREGSVKRVTGSGVAPVRYTSGVAELELDPGYTQSYAWTEERKLTSTGADTTEWTRTYFDWRGRPVQIVQGDTPANAVTRLRYNNKGQLWKQTDPDGLTTLFVYNEKGELARSALAVEGGDSPTLTGRDRVRESLSSVTDGHGYKVHRNETRVWTHENDPNPTSAAVVETAVDGKRRWVTSFDRTTTTEVGTLISGVRTVTTTYPDNSQLLRTFAGGRLTSALRRTAENGTTIKSLTYGYDGLGRLSTITDARDGVTSISQDLSTRSVTITTPAPGTGQAAQVTTHTFGPMGLLASTRLPDNSLTQTEYYLTGLPRKTYGSHTYPVDYTFDAQGRLQTMVTWQDYAGTTGQATNTWNYNQRGFLQSRTFHGGAAGQSYTYTPGGRLKTRTSARNIVTTYSYGFENAATYGLSDDLVQISYANDPAATPAVNLTYDRVGRLKTGGLNGGMASTLLYSDADGLLSETFSGGALNGMVVTNVFDALGRRATNGVFYSGQWRAQSAYTYDNASRLATASLPLANVSATYGRDIANSPLLSALTFREGGNTRLTVSRNYDLLDRLTSMQSAPAGVGESLIKTAYAYDLLNQRTALTNADNSFWTFGYDSKGQVQSGKHYWSDQTPVAGQQFEYQFDDIGNRKQVKSGGDAQGLNLLTTSYTLKANRLNQYDTRTLPGFADVLGEATNTASVNVNGQMAGRKGSYYRVELALTNTSAAAWLGITNVAVLNQGGTNADIIATNIGSLFVPGSPETFGYDAEGNMTADGRWSYTWDAENRLVSMESLANAPADSKRRLTFEYDWRWRRVRLGASAWTNNAWSVTVSNKFVFDGWNLLAEFNATNNAVIRSYLWGSDLSGTLRGAGGVGGLLAIRDQSTINGQPTTHFTCFDGNGNVIGLVNAADGKISARYEYGPFGELLRATGPMAKANPFRFSTKYQDDETGFLYYGFRFYRPDLGRWLNQDPIGEAGGLNLYGFLGNQSLGRVDVHGLADFQNHWNVGFDALSRAGLSLNWTQSECFRRGLILPDLPLLDTFGAASSAGWAPIMGGIQAKGAVSDWVAQFTEPAAEFVDDMKKAYSYLDLDSPLDWIALASRPIADKIAQYGNRAEYWWDDSGFVGPVLAHTPLINRIHTVRTHYGNEGYYHGMGKTGQDAAAVQQDIINAVNKMLKAFQLNRNKDCCRAYIELGKAIHVLTDSWTGGHTARDPSGSITLFQDYNRQSKHFHGGADNLAAASPGNYSSAVLQSAQLIQQAISGSEVDSSGYFQLGDRPRVGILPGTGRRGLWDILVNGYEGEE